MDKLSKDEQKEIKKTMHIQYKELEVLMNKWDPIGLIRGGAPSNEYDCLTTQVLSLLHRGKQLQEIEDFIYKELDEHFGYSLKNIKEEYQEKFKNKVGSFSIEAYDWFYKSKLAGNKKRF